jgi:hypothetical protein
MTNRVMRRAVGGRLLGLALVCSCGSDEATVKDRLMGSWFADLGGQAGVGYLFNKDNTFEYRLGTTSGSLVEVEAYLGDYELRDRATAIPNDDGTYLFLQATTGTCPGAWTGSNVVAFVGDSLRLVNDGGATVLQRSSDKGDSSGIVTFGCFDEDLDFYPSPVRPLDGGPPSCEPGEISACFCSSTLIGEQACDADGNAYGKCDCS